MTQLDPELLTLAGRYPDLTPTLPDIQAAYNLLYRTYANGGKVLICGNGGSASDSEHIVGELMKGFRLARPVPADLRAKLAVQWPADADYLADHLQGALPTISLVSQSALITAFANDVAADMVFAQQVYGYGRPGDVLIGISTSGNSANVVNAVKIAKTLGLAAIGLTGHDGGRLRTLCEVTICAPGTETLAIQERHLPIYHTLSVMLERAFFGAE